MKRLADWFFWQLAKLYRLRFWYLARQGNPAFFYLFIGLNNALAIFVLGYIAHLTAWPLLFPSLGPTLFLAFYAPQRAISAPKNALLSHLLGAITGMLCLLLFRQLGWAQEVLALSTVAAAALTVGVVGSLMTFFKILHPPAASTALLAALGYFDHFSQFLGLMVALTLILLQAKLMHTLAGVDYPLWAPKEEEALVLKGKGFTLRPSQGPPQDLAGLGEVLIRKGSFDQKN